MAVGSPSTFRPLYFYLASYGDMSDDIFGVRGIVGVPRWWSSPAATGKDLPALSRGKS